jgi:predicted dehydrogenase
MDEIRVGVIGVGYLGKFHAEKYYVMDNVRLAGVADIERGPAVLMPSALWCRRNRIIPWRLIF